MLFTTVYGAAAVGLACRNVVTQVLGQGAALALAASQAHLLFARHPNPTGLALLAAGALALAAGLPFWAAQDRFTPVLGKRSFLLGALASGAVAVRLLFLSFDTARAGAWYFAVLGALLTAMLLAQATAVVRMRGWGVLLATVTGASCLVPAVVWHGTEAWLSMLAMGASAALVWPLVAARRAGPTRQRVELDSKPRIELVSEEPEPESERAERSAPLRAAV